MAVAPVLRIKDKEYTLVEPKARLWRNLIKLQERPGEFDTWITVVTTCFSNYGITEDDILDNVGVAEVAALSFQCISYVNDLVNQGLSGVLEKNVVKGQA